MSQQQQHIGMATAARFAAAIERNDLRTTRRLLERGADINTRCPNPRDHKASWYALLRAAYLGHAEIVRVLLDAGARSDLRIGSDQIFTALIEVGGGRSGGGGRSNDDDDDVNVNFAQELAAAARMQARYSACRPDNVFVIFFQF